MRRMTTCGGCEPSAPVTTANGDPVPKECVGCAELPIEEFDADSQTWETMLFGSTSITFGGDSVDSETGNPYDGDRTAPRKSWRASLLVRSGEATDGSCQKDAYGLCVPDTSCRHEIVLDGTLTYSWSNYDADGNQIVPSPEWGGPGITQTPPPGWTWQPEPPPSSDPSSDDYESWADPDSPDYDPDRLAEYGQQTTGGGFREHGAPEPVFAPLEPGSTLGTFTVAAGLTWRNTFDPGCGATIESAVNARDFALDDPERYQMTNVPETGTLPIRLRLSCTPCTSQAKPTKPADSVYAGPAPETFQAIGAKAASGSIYTIDSLAYRVTPADGTTALSSGSCAQVTSCSYSAVYTITGTMVDLVGEDGPSLTIEEPAGATVGTLTAAPTKTVVVDNGDGTGTFALSWSWTLVIAPGCGSTTTVTFPLASIAPSTGWSKVDDGDAVPAVVAYSCSAAAAITEYTIVSHMDKTTGSELPPLRIVKPSTGKNRKDQEGDALQVTE